MARDLPPLNALRAFEAAARHGSFTGAGEELGVAHAAISRHVAHLEAHLGAALFERTGRGVVLTEDGRLLATAVGKAFDQIALATRVRKSSSRRSHQLVITTDTAFATYWLVPRLYRFTLQHPKINLTIDPTPRLIDFAKESFDLGIRFGLYPETWTGVTAEKFSDARVTVVCSPQLMAAHRRMKPQDIPAHQMLQDRDRALWAEWLKAAGMPNKIVPTGPELLSDLAIRAAESGQGFALADRFCAADALVGKRLVAPLAITVASSDYYLVSRAGKSPSPATQTFIAWLKDEVKQTVAKTKTLFPT